MKTKTTPIALTAALLAFTPVANAQSFSNGSFEEDERFELGTTAPAGWTFDSDASPPGYLSYTFLYGPATFASDGDHAMLFQFYNAGGLQIFPAISQSVSGFDTGLEYQISFDAALGNIDPEIDIVALYAPALDIYFDDVFAHSIPVTNLLADLSATSGNPPATATGSLQPYSFNFTAPAETLVIGFRSSGNEDSAYWMAFDNLNITSVPKPSGALLVSLAGTLALLRRIRAV